MWRRGAVIVLILTGMVSLMVQELPAQSGHIAELRINGAIDPSSADYFHRGLEKARERGALLAVLHLDTPGGLDASMRIIIKDILASPIPVVAYVSPPGARAASAGTYILYAAHIAAMAPGTNLGAATPIRIGGMPEPGKTESPKPDKPESAKKPTDEGTLSRKMVNDAVAYIRSLAQLHGRNAEWAERAVREAVSLSAEEAARIRVVDLVAPDVPTLLKRIDGRTVKVLGQSHTLQIANLPVIQIEPDWRSRLLSVIADPNLAYILMLLGIYGLFFELWNPGFILPGVVGAICLLLALFAFQVLPISYAGLGLILLGIAFMVAEAFVPSFGALGIGGVIAFVAGSVMLLDTDVPGFGISLWLIGSIALVSAVFFLGVVLFALKARRRRVVSGAEELVGADGICLEDFSRDGRVRVHSEDWNARTVVPLVAGQPVRVTGRNGLILIVEPLTEEH